LYEEKNTKLLSKKETREEQRLFGGQWSRTLPNMMQHLLDLWRLAFHNKSQRRDRCNHYDAFEYYSGNCKSRTRAFYEKHKSWMMKTRDGIVM